MLEEAYFSMKLCILLRLLGLEVILYVFPDFGLVLCVYSYFYL